LARDEELLVGEAKGMRFDDWQRCVQYWAQHADPDGTDDKARDDVDARKVHFSKSIGGMFFGTMTMDGLSGTVFGNELGRLSDAMFRADWAEATERLGRKPLLSELRRTPAQRRADALVEMATRSRTMPADGQRPAPLFTVYVGYETFHGRICEVAGVGVVAPGALVPWLDEALIERVVFDPESRPIDVGRRRRLFKGATRRAVEVRDRECDHPYCDVPAEHCQVDHIIPYAAGGPTIIENGRLRCGAHNRARHQRPPPHQDD
jgi:hypothetical protein